MSVLETIRLNDAQREAVAYNEGSQLVFAGAGTGKTRVLTAKIAWLIRERGLRPHTIFAATFTNRAAREMKERIAELINMNCDGLWIGTFHSLCVRILRSEGHRLGYSRWFTIYDSTDQLALVKAVLKESDVDEKNLRPKSLLGTISSYKNRCITPEVLQKQAQSVYETEILELYRAYQKGLMQADAMDFDDLILNVVLLLSSSAQTAREYRDLFSYILVDEYQDTNRAQFRLISLLAHDEIPVFAVGDDDQSIYGWRGADIDNILNFESSFGNTRVFKLQQNYRSSAGILNFANSIIAKNQNRSAKKLWTAGDHGEDVLIRAYSNDIKEAEGITESIRRSLKVSGVSPAEIAVFFRTNAQTRQLEKELLKRDIPYKIVGGTAFFSRKEIKDILAYLKCVVNHRDDVNCQRIINVPSRGIGNKSQDRIAQSARRAGRSFFEHILSGEAEEELKGKAKKSTAAFRSMYQALIELYDEGATPEEITNTVLTETAYLDELQNSEGEEAQNRVENINEFVNAVAQWQMENSEGRLENFLEEITLASDADDVDDAQTVKLMTLHTSKGLEFQEVYVAGVEDGLLPSMQSVNDFDRMEEERRLLYVGATRAKERLVCSYCESRMRFGSVMPMGISPFLESLDTSLYRLIDETARFNSVYWSEESSAATHQPRRVAASGRSGRGRIKRGAPAIMRGSDFLRKEPPSPPKTGSSGAGYRMGQRVSHGKFGTGKILSVSGVGSNMRLTVLFSGGVRKQLIAKYAKLDIL
ncbi:MAG: ATP-dependent helicase [Fibrobacterota bacterium]